MLADPRKTTGSASRLPILTPAGSKMRLGYRLNRVFRYSKLVALATAIFLLFSTLDNIPDCPQLLKSRSESVALSIVHHPPPKCLDRIQGAWTSPSQPEICTHYVSGAFIPLSPPCATRCLNQAADPSPPVA
jgi:hypothetical protein